MTTEGAHRGLQACLMLPVNARISSLNAYLDAFGGGGIPQSVRLALYTDANGVPGSKVVESVEKTFKANYPPAWEPFETPTVIVPAGKSWIVIHSANTGGVVRDYADGTARRRAKTDALARMEQLTQSRYGRGA